MAGVAMVQNDPLEAIPTSLADLSLFDWLWRKWDQIQQALMALQFTSQALKQADYDESKPFHSMHGKRDIPAEKRGPISEGDYELKHKLARFQALQLHHENWDYLHPEVSPCPEIESLADEFFKESQAPQIIHKSLRSSPSVNYSLVDPIYKKLTRKERVKANKQERAIQKEKAKNSATPISYIAKFKRYNAKA